MATTPGDFYFTTIESGVLAALFATMHETLHREGVTEALTDKERALYDAVVAELTERAKDVKRRSENGSATP